MKDCAGEQHFVFTLLVSAEVGALHAQEAQDGGEEAQSQPAHQQASHPLDKCFKVQLAKKGSTKKNIQIKSFTVDQKKKMADIRAMWMNFKAITAVFPFNKIQSSDFSFYF